MLGLVLFDLISSFLRLVQHTPLTIYMISNHVAIDDAATWNFLEYKCRLASTEKFLLYEFLLPKGPANDGIEVHYPKL